MLAVERFELRGEMIRRWGAGEMPCAGFKMRCEQEAFNISHKRKEDAQSILQICAVAIGPKRKHSVFCSVMPSPSKIHDLMKYYTLKITLLKQNII